MYSKRNGRFYLPGPGGHHLLSFDSLILTSTRTTTSLSSINCFFETFQSHPSLSGICRSCFLLLPRWNTSWRHLPEVNVSSSNGIYIHSSLSTLYTYAYSSFGFEKSLNVTQLFVVFREEETTEGRCMCYTDDIGDMCIFIWKGETFCVPASSFPGLVPNSIYFIGFGSGIYDLTTKTAFNFQAPKGSLDQILAPYWFHPSSS
ncbi:unnamed protein product [Microthlaspi erraticum]|uniref:KIB1-4 beta-propeller domain-containing protein n=1 Tax=Microthlaspi erraticum TaxID=1685480 RepID=A0A6D2HM32_9BRAS|nr:unnamed protein product [Microthlaspi erraticum]